MLRRAGIHAECFRSNIAWVAEEQCFLAYCLQSLNIIVFEVHSGQIQHRKTLRFQPANERAYKKLVRSAEHGRLVVCGSDGGLLQCWDLLTGERLPHTLDFGGGQWVYCFTRRCITHTSIPASRRSGLARRLPRTAGDIGKALLHIQMMTLLTSTS